MKWLGRVSNLRWKVVTLLVAPITFVMTLDRAAMTVAAHHSEGVRPDDRRNVLDSDRVLLDLRARSKSRLGGTRYFSSAHMATRSIVAPDFGKP